MDTSSISGKKMENPYKDTKNTKHYVFWERGNQRLSRQVNRCQREKDGYPSALVETHLVSVPDSLLKGGKESGTKTRLGFKGVYDQTKPNPTSSTLFGHDC